jgi:hypothetical protein
VFKVQRSTKRAIWWTVGLLLACGVVKNEVIDPLAEYSCDRVQDRALALAQDTALDVATKGIRVAELTVDNPTCFPQELVDKARYALDLAKQHGDIP